MIVIIKIHSNVSISLGIPNKLQHHIKFLSYIAIIQVIQYYMWIRIKIVHFEQLTFLWSNSFFADKKIGCKNS